MSETEFMQDYSMMDTQDDGSILVAPVNDGDGNEGGLKPAPVKDKANYTFREKVRLVLIGFRLQLLIVFIAFVDIILLIIQLAQGDKYPSLGILIVIWIIVGVYTLEIVMRLVALQFYLFFKSPGNIFDFLIVLVSIILISLAEAKAGTAVRILRFLRAAQALRAIRALAIMQKQSSVQSKTSGNLFQAARNITGENKKRYVDLQNSIDIDLTYINTQIIAMGVPATGFISWFRNPIDEVVKFFNLRHKNAYRIYNVCPEHPYPHERFDNNVRAYDVQDHTPPTMDIIMTFLADASEFVKGGKQRVLAVHCRGGKGRTGTMVCSWLLYSGYCRTAEDALTEFATARTELRKASNKLQGVDTPSQKRYVKQIAEWLARNNAYLDTGVPLQKPPATEIRLRQVTISKFFVDPSEVEAPLVAAVHLNGKGGGKIIKISKPLTAEEILSNEFTFDLERVQCGGDIRVTIFKLEKLKKAVSEGLVLADADGLRGPQELTKRKIAGKEPGVVFYFLFHSEFIDRDSCSLKVHMNMMDKAFKNKKKKFNPDGYAQLDVEFTTHNLT
eukprot:m.335385 g.335385  ORF g.335385 m.335385 type:complete len:559 (-) comp17585_c0_seq1:74-1750(-)